QALQAAQGGAGNSNSRRENVTNYEVDKTVRVTRNATGTVKRLNAAVVVNHHVSTDAKGKTVSTPLTPTELEQLTALVQQAVGFSKERGDSGRVINAPFRVEAAPKPEDVPLWQRPALQDLLHTLAMPFALALVGLAVVFGMIRPALKAVLPPPATRGTQLDAMVDDALPLPSAA